MKKSRDNYTFLTHAPVHRVIFTMAIPTIISMLSTSMYNLADTYFVGSINTQSVAAVGVSFAMMAVIQAVGFFYGHGAGNYISRMLGAKEVEKAKKMAATGFILSFLTGLFIAFLGQLFLTPLCVLLGSTPTIQPYTERYLGIILLGAPFMTTSLTLNNLMRFQGNTMYAMKGIMSGVLLNLILAPLLILILPWASRVPPLPPSSASASAAPCFSGCHTRVRTSESICTTSRQPGLTSRRLSLAARLPYQDRVWEASPR